MRFRNCVPTPPEEVLVALFGAMYYVSLRTEESESITFDIVYRDPKNPDPDPPRRVTNDRWSFVRFEQPIALTIRNLIKIAKASDSRTSSFAVHSDSDGHL